MLILSLIAGIAVAIEIGAIITTEWLMVLWLTGRIQPWRLSWT